MIPTLGGRGRADEPSFNQEWQLKKKAVILNLAFDLSHECSQAFEPYPSRWSGREKEIGF